MTSAAVCVPHTAPSAGVPPRFPITQSVGGTLYGHTPGGSTFVYRPVELLALRGSASCPRLPHVPGVTLGTTSATSGSPEELVVRRPSIEDGGAPRVSFGADDGLDMDDM